MEILVVNNYRTITNWRSINRQEKRSLEMFAKKINKDIDLKRTAVFLFGSLMYCQNVLAKNADLSKLNSGGATVLNLVQGVGYWIAIVMASYEIIKNLMQGDSKSTGKTIMKYSLGYGSLFLLPWIFDLVKGIFS